MSDISSLLSERITPIAPSGIRKFFDILNDMDDAISLGVGEPDFITPWHIRDAGVYSLEKGFTKYTSNAGMLSLRSAVADYMARRFALRYDPENEIILTVGGSEAIDLALRVLLNPGDEVIIPMPSFVCYEPLTRMAGGVPVIIETKEENEFRVTPEELTAALSPRTKAIVLPYPCNPTGAIMRREDLEALADVLRDRNIAIISDEIYSELTYGEKHVSPANLPELFDRTIVINGFSKTYAMTGWRLGYACGPKAVMKQMLKLHQFAIMCAPTTAQYAAIEALNNGDQDVLRMRQDYDRRRRLLLQGVRDAGLECFEPRGAFYMFPCIKSTGLSSDEFCERFLLEEKVAVISGSAFGAAGEGFVRMCYAASTENLMEALRRLRLFLEKI